MFWTVTQTLLSGLLTTFEIFAFTLLFALPLGLVIAFGSMSKFKPLKWLIHTIVWIIRGTPLMLQLLIIFYGPGMIGWHVWSGNETGIEGVPAGQREAGEVLGMTKGQIFRKITLVQMIKRIVPPMSNEIITLVKDTSLARTIAAYELTFTGYSFMKSAGLVWPLFYTGIFYLLFVGILTLIFNYVERRLSYFK